MNLNTKAAELLYKTVHWADSLKNTVTLGDNINMGQNSNSNCYGACSQKSKKHNIEVEMLSI